MGNVYPSLESMIGHTPLMALSRIMAKENLCATVLAKLEYMNPAGSVKDRAAYQMIITTQSAAVCSPRAQRSSSRQAATPASAWPPSPRHGATAP